MPRALWPASPLGQGREAVQEHLQRAQRDGGWQPAFRDAWRKAQHCVIPADAFYEPDWRSGRHVATRIERADGESLGIAGLWSWCPLGGQDGTLSFTMLTINADTHQVMCNYHRPDDEKRMIVLLRQQDFDAWLDASAERSMDFMRQCPPGDLVAIGEPRTVAPMFI